jgi:hypothetical protein
VLCRSRDSARLFSPNHGIAHYYGSRKRGRQRGKANATVHCLYLGGRARSHARALGKRPLGSGESGVNYIVGMGRGHIPTAIGQRQYSFIEQCQYEITV